MSKRTYPPISRQLHEQLSRIPPSRDGGLEYRPCALTLEDGSEYPRVNVVEQAQYTRTWRVLPGDDPGRLALPIGSVRSIRESPHRLPAHLADELYRAGESGMGYCIFRVEFKDGQKQAYLTGSAVDFIEAPPGLRALDAVAVRPHEGRQDVHQKALDYHWCLYDGVDSFTEGPDV
ncbi:MAG: hypothetical protein H6838_04115 [Planctomycetes bacterium]|nr:hypothetical protein [Planctomycetota bacterium]